MNSALIVFLALCTVSVSAQVNTSTLEEEHNVTANSSIWVWSPKFRVNAHYRESMIVSCYFETTFHYFKVGRLIGSLIATIMSFIAACILTSYLEFVEYRFKVEVLNLVVVLVNMVMTIVTLGMAGCSGCYARIIVMFFESMGMVVLVVCAWIRVNCRVYFGVAVFIQYMLLHLQEGFVSMWLVDLRCEMGSMIGISMNMVGGSTVICLASKMLYHLLNNQSIEVCNHI